MHRQGRTNFPADRIKIIFMSGESNYDVGRQEKKEKKGKYGTIETYGTYGKYARNAREKMTIVRDAAPGKTSGGNDISGRSRHAVLIAPK